MHDVHNAPLYFVNFVKPDDAVKLLESHYVVKLWKPNDDNVSKLIRRLEKCIDGYFSSKYKLNDFKLARINFAANIDVGSRRKVSAYIKVLCNIGKVKGFSPKYDRCDAGHDSSFSFALEGNSNGIEFTVYDKETVYKKEGSYKHKGEIEALRGILCADVCLTKQKAIRKPIRTLSTNTILVNMRPCRVTGLSRASDKSMKLK